MVVLDDVVERGHWRQVKVGGLSDEELEDGATDAPDVRRIRRAVELDDLGCHPIRCAHDIDAALVVQL